MPHPNPIRLLWTLAAVLLSTSFHPSATARPKIGVTVKQAEPPRLGDFAQFEHKFFDHDGNEESSGSDTVEIDRVVKDEATGRMRYRSRSFSRDRTEQAGDLISTLSSLLEGDNYFSWTYIDPGLKAWVIEYQDEEWDDEKNEPTGRTTTMIDLDFPAPLTGQGQVIEDGDTVLKVISMNRKVTVPAGTFRCVVTEVHYPSTSDDPDSEGSVFLNYTHQRIGVVRGEMFAVTKGERRLNSRMDLQWAELHNEDGIKSHRDYALKNKKIPADSKEKAEKLKSK